MYVCVVYNTVEKRASDEKRHKRTSRKQIENTNLSRRGKIGVVFDMFKHYC